MTTPFVSLIMPVRNERVYIQRSLEAVLQQDYPSECLEIFIVDGMSDDGTREYVQSLQQVSPNLYLLDNPQMIVPFALNRALRQSKGEIIVRVDGHCEIAPDYVSQCVKHLLTSNAAGVGGPIETIGETETARAISLAMSSWFGMGGSAFRTIKDQELWVETVAFPAYKREMIDSVGLFDEELVRNQDDEYNYRIRKAGGRILLTPDIQSMYYSRGSLHKLWKQFYQYGYWKVRVLQKHSRQMRWVQFVPFAFVMTTWASLIFPPLSILLLAYLLGNSVASFSLARAGRWRNLPLLMLIFPIMHFAYGLGFARGLVAFIGRWGDQTGQTPNA
ncbi:MAG: glycosyltransferase family 2 protein [Candidatus Promineifilaceae bacterium]